MTMDIYKKKYNEALERAKSFKTPELRDVAEYIFPELAESEDEKIRKELIDIVKKSPITFAFEDKNKVLAWLEKQDEKKPIEEVNGEDYGIDGLWHAQRILENTLGSVDGYQTDDGILDHKAAITAVKKLYKQKSAWSEEDQNALKDVREAVVHY